MLIGWPNWSPLPTHVEVCQLDTPCVAEIAGLVKAAGNGHVCSTGWALERRAFENPTRS
jgi:hypothetical protein